MGGGFGAWADKLDEGAYAEIVRLWEHGQCVQLHALERQLRTALRRDPPPHDDVRSTSQSLLDVLASRGDAESLLISNGMTKGDEKE